MTQNITTCRLFDKMALNSNEYVEYEKPIYTKLNGIYGYLSVSVFNIHFFWHDGTNVCFDDVSDRFRVEYTFKKNNVI